MRLASFALVLSVALTGCRKTTVSSAPTAPPTLVPGLFVNSAGSWWAPHGTGSFQLEVTGSGNSFEERISTFPSPGPPTGVRGSSGSGPINIPPWSPDWFIYAEETGATKYLWYYGSSNRLWYRVIKGRASDSETVRIIDEKGGLVSKTQPYSKSRPVPADVILRLPPKLQKLFPKVEPPTKRPSF